MPRTAQGLFEFFCYAGSLPPVPVTSPQEFAAEIESRIGPN